VIGEGGSGGALAIGVGDRTLMLEYAVYSVISPEGCASILWKSAESAREAAEALGITSKTLTGAAGASGDARQDDMDALILQAFDGLRAFQGSLSRTAASM
jgi:hypothetical protein